MNGPQATLEPTVPAKRPKHKEDDDFDLIIVDSDNKDITKSASLGMKGNTNNSNGISNPKFIDMKSMVNKSKQNPDSQVSLWVELEVYLL